MADKLDLRKTKQRTHLLDILTKKKEPMTADQIFKNCQLWCPGMALTTVYRNLDRMVELGYVTRIESPKAAARYLAADVHKRFLLTCKVCGDQEEITDVSIKLLEAYVHDTCGFEVQQANLEFYGVCKKCKDRMP